VNYAALVKGLVKKQQPKVTIWSEKPMPGEKCKKK